jgi:hypothetical protein
MARKMKRYDEGGEVDALEEANKRTEGMLSNPNAKEYGESGTSETTTVMAKATPKAAPKPKVAPKPAAKSESKPAAKAAPVDETKLSLTERMKMSRDRARSGSTTDKRSVTDRIKASFGMKNGGSASSRADGIASRGKTNCKMY